jgi:dTDP-4-dehydrorhamnose 3,5-epimerase-like enzyme
MLWNDRSMKASTGLEKVASIELTTFSEANRGHLTVLQAERDVPFAIARIFYIYGLPKDSVRGSHAHRQTEQAFIAIKGSLLLELSDGRQTKTHRLSGPDRVVYVPPMIWARLHGFSDGAVCLVLASSSYDASDYIRDWDQYVSLIGGATPEVHGQRMV